MPTPAEILVRHKAQQKAAAEERRRRVPLPSSNLPIDDRLRMFPIADARRAEAARRKNLHDLCTLIDAARLYGRDIMPVDRLEDALISTHQGDDGLFYARIDVGGGYYLADPHCDEAEAKANGWDLMYLIAGFYPWHALDRLERRGLITVMRSPGL